MLYSFKFCPITRCHVTPPLQTKHTFKKLIYSCFSHFRWLTGLSRVAPTQSFSWNYSPMLLGTAAIWQGCPLKSQKGPSAKPPFVVSPHHLGFTWHGFWDPRGSIPKASIPRDPGPRDHPTSKVRLFTSVKAVSRQAHLDLRGWRNGSMF